MADKYRSRARFHLHPVGTAVFLACAAMAQPALAASSPENLCTGAIGSATAFPSDQSMNAAATAATNLVLGGKTQNEVEQVLSLDAAQTATPSYASLQTYCAVAGDAARKLVGGSDMQAQVYLLSAFRYATAAGHSSDSARIAFQLGLLNPSVAASGPGGVRGAGEVSAIALKEADSAPADACNRLQTTDAVGNRGRYLSALALECSAAQARNAGDYKLAAVSSLRLARLVMAAGSTSRAREKLFEVAGQNAQAAIADASLITDSHQRAEVIGRLVETALDAGNQDNAGLSHAVATMQESAQGDLALGAVASALEGRLALARNDRAAAKAALERAAYQEGQLATPWRMSDWLLLLASADPQNARSHLVAAYRALESVRPLLPRLDPLTEESMFTLRMQKVFEAATAAELAAAGSADDVQNITNVQKIVESYRQAELQDVLGNDCVPVRTPVEPRDLRANEMIYYPVLTQGRLELIYASGEDTAKGQPRYHRLQPIEGVTKGSAYQVVSDLATLTSQARGDKWRDASRTLYDLVIKPIEGKLRPGMTLVIVPDGALRSVPFAALIDEQGQYLVKKYNIAVAPALAFAQPGRDSSANGLRVVSAALDREVVLPSGDFPRLANTVDEARTAAGLDQPGARKGVFIRDFSKADIEHALESGRVDVLHLATHAAFNGRSDRSFIVANNEIIPITDLRDAIQKNFVRGDDLRLLVLSACETAVGDEQAAMGLAGAAVQSGAESALASLWQVDDRGTLDLMKTFYGGLRQGKSRGEALRLAQLSMIDKGGSSADPRLWAAFTLLGGWR